MYMEICIYTIKNQYNPTLNFKSNNEDWNVLGFDEGGQDKRDYIRKWHEENYLPYQSIYEKEGRMSEYQLKNLLAQFVRKPTALNNEKLAKISLYNLETLGNTNSARGAMVKGYELEKLSMLKDAGIRRIVSLMQCSELEKACKNLGLEYLYFDMNSNAPCMEDKQAIEQKSRLFWENIANIKDNEELERRVNYDIGSWRQKAEESIEKLIEFLQFMQKGNVYIGCACGTYRTDFAVMLNKLFSPLADYTCEMTDCLSNVGAIKNLFKNLTEAHKLKMGWSKSFEKQFLSRLSSIKQNIVVFFYKI